MNDNRKNWIRESGSKLLLTVFALVYLLSFFLPAYSTRLNLSGYECAYIAFAVVFDANVGIDGGFLVQLLTKVHFLLLGLHNVIVPVCLMLYKKMTAGHFRWLINILAITIPNTIIFFFYNYFGEQIANEELLLGYYVWVCASVLIYVLLKYNMKSTETVNF